MQSARLLKLHGRRPSQAHTWVCVWLAALGACSPAAQPSVGAGSHVGDRCAKISDCGAGLTCHYEGSSAAPRNVCRLDVGRCRFDRDCGAQQLVCRRFGVQLGVCEPAL